MKTNMNNEIICKVEDKISSILLCEHVKDTITTKPDRAGAKYLATNKIYPELLDKLKNGIKYRPTGKIDGTCCNIKDGRIWKRRDLKSEREKPHDWIMTGKQPDNTTGHLIGIMPLDKGDVWHLDCYVKKSENTKTKTYIMEKIMILDLNKEGNGLEYKEIDTESLNGCSVEIMGPKFQKNPHKLKMHCVMKHGIITLNDFPDLTHYIDNSSDILNDIKNWFTNSQQGPYLEGVVLHLDDGSMFKLHRHHLDMKWNNGTIDDILPLDQISI